MYNGIGLATPRGSGTNGHVQRNWAVVKPLNREKTYKTEQELTALDTASNRQPNKDILDHERKRKMELKCAEFADILEGQGFNEETINNKVNNYRNMLMGQHGKLDKPVDQWGRPCATETHQVAEAQQEKNARLREAFGISEYFVDGSSFDPDRQAKEKLAKSVAIQEKDKQKAIEREKEKIHERAQATRYQLVHTPSPEPLSPVEKDTNLKKKKRKHRDSSSSEEPKKKKKKKTKKKDRSNKTKDKKKKRKQRKEESSADSVSSSENEESSSADDRKKKKNKKEKRRISKKRRFSSSESSRESSAETSRKYKSEKTHKSSVSKERLKKNKQKELKKEKWQIKSSRLQTKDKQMSPDEKDFNQHARTSPSLKSCDRGNTHKDISSGRYSKEQNLEESGKGRKPPYIKSTSVEKSKRSCSRSLERGKKSRTRSPVSRQEIKKSMENKEKYRKNKSESVERSRRSRSKSFDHKNKYRKDIERKDRDERSKSTDKGRARSRDRRSRYDKYSEKSIQKHIANSKQSRKRQSRSPENKGMSQSLEDNSNSSKTKFENRQSKSLSPSRQSPNRKKYSSKRSHSPRKSPEHKHSPRSRRQSDEVLKNTILSHSNAEKTTDLKSSENGRYRSCSPREGRYDHVKRDTRTSGYIKEYRKSHSKSRSPVSKKDEYKMTSSDLKDKVGSSPTSKLLKNREHRIDEINRKTSRDRSSDRHVNRCRPESSKRSKTPEIKYKPARSPSSHKSKSSTPDIALVAKQKKEVSEKLSRLKKPLPVVRLRASSSEAEPSGNEYEKEDEIDDKELRMLRLLKSDLAVKAKESLERKKEKFPSPKPVIKRNIEPDVFDIKVLPLKITKDKSLTPINKDEFDIERNGSTSKARSGSKSTYSKNRKSKSKSRSSSRSSTSLKGSRRSNSSSSSNSLSPSRSRSVSRSASRGSSVTSSSTSSSTSRSRSPSIPRRHGSPSFLDRRRITRHK